MLVTFVVVKNSGTSATVVPGVQNGTVSQNNLNGADANTPATDKTVDPTPVLPPATVTATITVTVDYTDSGFSPNAVTINRGDTVVFENKSSSSFWPASNNHPTHTLYDGTSLQQHCASPTGDTFDACGGIPPGGSWSFTFNKSGTWNYHNHLRASDTGTIIVQ